MHTLAFLEPGHFHAALTLGARHPRVREEIFVYAEPGAELDDFLALIEAFNARAEAPTAWRAVVRAGDQPLERLVAERPGDVVILAGRNDRKMTLMRRLHDAGLHVLADKPWLTGAAGLEDLRHALSGGALAVELMTGRHEVTSILMRKLAGEPDVLGDLDTKSGTPAIEISGVHHLEKTVNGKPLRRPVWYFDVRAQGDGLADIPTHMVDQVQRVIAAARPERGAAAALELIAARTWATHVPRELFSRVTGRPAFPDDLGGLVRDDELAYRCNAELSFRSGDVAAALDTRWELSEPPGGGDTHRSAVHGTRAHIVVEQHAGTGFRRTLSILPRRDESQVWAALAKIAAEWQGDYPGLSLVERGRGCEIQVPRGFDVGHERHFPLVLAEFLSLVERGLPPARLNADTLAKYTLLARAAAGAPPPRQGTIPPRLR